MYAIEISNLYSHYPTYIIRRRWRQVKETLRKVINFKWGVEANLRGGVLGRLWWRRLSYAARTVGGGWPDWWRRGAEETSAPGIVEVAGSGAGAIQDTRAGASTTLVGAMANKSGHDAFRGNQIRNMPNFRSHSRLGSGSRAGADVRRLGLGQRWWFMGKRAAGLRAIGQVVAAQLPEQPRHPGRLPGNTLGCSTVAGGK